MRQNFNQRTNENGEKKVTTCRVIGFVFAPQVAYSWGVCGPGLLRLLWAVADRAGRNAYALGRQLAKTSSRAGTAASPICGCGVS
jgi:hypothetical protein